MNILVFGGSGFASPYGPVGGLQAQFPGARVTTRLASNSPGTQFAYYGGMDFGRFDAVVFGSVVPDEVHLQQAGGYRFVASLYHELFSTIQAQTNLYVVGASGARNIEQPSEVYYMYADLAEAAGARFVSLRDFIVEHGEAIVAGDAPRMGDEAHVHPAIGQQFGHYLGRVIADTLRDRRPARNFARNFVRGLPAVTHR